jgi:hypothetical protein
MPRIRTIKPEFQISASMGRVSREARLTFILLWPQCDDSGRVRGNSRMLASVLFPYDDDAVRLIDGWLGELEKDGCIIRYEIEGTEFIAVSVWSHQKIDHPSPSRLPAPPDKKAKKTRIKPREHTANVSETSDKPRAVSSTGPEGKGMEVLSAKADMPEFQDFWNAYPTDKNMSKKAAEKQWNRLSPEKRSAAIAAVPGFKAYCAANSWYRPKHAEGWLSQERFEGYAAEAQPQTETDPSWGSLAGKLSAQIGDGNFQSYFADARVVDGDPQRIQVKSPLKKRLIEQKFPKQLRAAFAGDFVIEVAA